MDDPRLLQLKDEPPLQDEIQRLIKAQALAAATRQTKKPRHVKQLPPAPTQKVKNRVLRQRARRAQMAAREHVTDGPCWCEPEVVYTGPNGTKVFVHRQEN